MRWNDNLCFLFMIGFLMISILCTHLSINLLQWINRTNNIFIGLVKVINLHFFFKHGLLWLRILVLLYSCVSCVEKVFVRLDELKKRWLQRFYWTHFKIVVQILRWIFFVYFFLCLIKLKAWCNLNCQF